MSLSFQHSAAIVGLDQSVGQRLASILEEYGCRILAHARAKADLIFCSSDSPLLPRLLRQDGAKVVVVSRDDRDAAWLQALDAGASDYLCAPFERIDVRWVLESQLGSVAHAA